MSAKAGRTPMPLADPNARNRNFDEVALGYTEEMAKREAGRCLNCKNRPCADACPVNVNIPEFIEQVKKGDYGKAAEIIASTNALPAICGRVCPQESQCEGRCVLGKKGEAVAIGRLERFVGDWEIANNSLALAIAEPNGKKAAIVGAGPAGLTCAGELAKRGYAAVVFEAIHENGGVMAYGIPEFRLPKEIVRKEIEKLEKLGVTIVNNAIVGKTMSIDDLFADGFSSVFIASGAGLPSFMGIKGEGLLGVYSANEFLTRINLMKAYKDGYDTPIQAGRKTVVVGGGNVAMDAARCAKRLGSEPSIVYRRSEEELPARREEVEHAKEEGISFSLLCSPIEILGDGEGYVRAVKCIRMQLGEEDASGRRRPVEIPGTEFEVEADSVVMAIGTSPNPLVPASASSLNVDRHGCILVDEETLATSMAGVFAGGDIVSGAATVIMAMGAGRKAAGAMDKYMKGLPLST
jgi:glutamate synthase (NADPH/NADH) small chain